MNQVTYQDNKTEKANQANDVERAEDQPVFVPATDIYELPDKLVVLSDMPGVDEKHVDITLENDVLTLTGYQDTQEPTGHALVHRGYRSGIFERSFTIREHIDRDKIKAKMACGVLRIELPKAAEAQPRKIAVESDG